MKRNDEKKQEYLNWLLTPPGEREPATKLAFAELIGVNRNTLYNWEDDEQFQTELRAIKGKWATRWYGDILGKLKEIVDTRNDSVAVSAANTLLKHLDLGDEKKDADEITEDMKIAIKKALEDEGYRTL